MIIKPNNNRDLLNSFLSGQATLFLNDLSYENKANHGVGAIGNEDLCNIEIAPGTYSISNGYIRGEDIPDFSININRFGTYWFALNWILINGKSLQDIFDSVFDLESNYEDRFREYLAEYGLKLTVYR